MDFLLEMLDDQLMLTIHPTSDANQEQREWIHHETVTRSIARGQSLSAFIVEKTVCKTCSFPMDDTTFVFSDPAAPCEPFMSHLSHAHSAPFAPLVPL